jgi:hypothetical protein
MDSLEGGIRLLLLVKWNAPRWLVEYTKTALGIRLVWRTRMSPSRESSDWWNLHLRKARGETLSDSEQHFYDAELARQDHDAPPLKSDLETLKKLRHQVLATGNVNSELRKRLSDLEEDIRHIEQSLSRETRQVLGVGE